MITTVADESGKIQPTHRERAAYIYIRQSSLRQVEQHTAGRQRQYDLLDWTVAMGWPHERIVVIDEDQGRSGAVPNLREGFGRLIGAVARGEVGIVVALEASRLARNSPDWHHLVYLCRWTQTLICDAHTIYDPQLSADRMVLGIRGQVSELELDNSIQRMVEARWSKARRGELVLIPPVGYEIDDLGQWVITSDESVANAIHLVFSKFNELASARQVFVWWHEQGLRFPVRRVAGRTHPVLWLPVTYRMILSTLHHPAYAGVYVFGRSQIVRELDAHNPNTLRVRRVQRKDWPVMIEGHHAAYIAFAEFLTNQRRIKDNQMMTSDEREHPGAAREGQALLQGLVRCGHCGRPMQVSYGGHHSRRANRTMQYRCGQARQQQMGKDCQIIGGKRIDEAVVAAFLEASAPAGLAAIDRVNTELAAQQSHLAQHWALQVEKAQYEAERAARQFHAVEPENRLVARTLEARWNERLVELKSVRQQAQAARIHTAPLTQDELARARDLGQDLAMLWKLDSVTMRDRKQLLRCLIEEVQLRTEEQCYPIRILWKGGAVTDCQVVRRAIGTGTATPEETIDLVRTLAQEFDDAQIARILNRQGRRTGRGNPFTAAKVQSLRGHYRIPKCPSTPIRDPREGPFNADEAAAELGVSMTTIHRWLRTGVLAGEQVTPGAPWRIRLSEAVRQRLCAGSAPADWVGVSEAARRLGLSTSRVVYLVETGKLEAIYTTVRNRRCWRINVDSSRDGSQSELFEQMSNATSDEA